jgi:hypothetical protein
VEITGAGRTAALTTGVKLATRKKLQQETCNLSEKSRESELQVSHGLDPIRSLNYCSDELYSIRRLHSYSVFWQEKTSDRN